MKIDVERAEDSVIAGARQVLETLRPVFILECFDMARMHALKGLRYRAYDLHEGCNWLVVPEENARQAETEWLPPAVRESAVAPANSDR